MLTFRVYLSCRDAAAKSGSAHPQLSPGDMRRRKMPASGHVENVSKNSKAYLLVHLIGGCSEVDNAIESNSWAKLRIVLIAAT